MVVGYHKRNSIVTKSSAAVLHILFKMLELAINKPLLRDELNVIIGNGNAY